MRKGTVMWQSWFVLLLSLWVVFGIGLLRSTPGGPAVNYLIIGIICSVLGLWPLFEGPQSSRRGSYVLIVVGGLWLGTVAFVHILQGTTMAVIIGSLVSIVSIWSVVPRQPASSK